MSLELELVPQKALVVRREKTVVAASWFGPGTLRPYIYPFVGPGERELTRCGHPRDPVGHSHHRSIWIGHHDVSGTSFWEESPAAGRIEQTSATLLVREGRSVQARLECEWRAPDGRVLLNEKRTLSFHDLSRGELALDIDTELRPVVPTKDGVITLGDTPFGLLGIRVAATMSVAEGLGGLIQNSQEAENEKGCLGQHAEWCDYSGPVPIAGAAEASPANAGTAPARVDPGAIAAEIAGVACFEHPDNTPGDTLWHVRDDGWMGPCISKGEPRALAASDVLRVRWRILAHAGRPWEARVGERYREWRQQAAGAGGKDGSGKRSPPKE
jgi:hypothetical protein